MKLFERDCVPVPAGTSPMSSGAAVELLRELDGWRLVDGAKISREFSFNSFAATLKFVNEVGAIAEECEHHPDFWFTYGKARLEISTHSINGLSENDFILAARIDRI